MKDEHPSDRLGAYADEALGQEEKTAIATHLEACPACREDLRALRTRDAALAASLVPDPGPAYWSSFAARVEARTGQTPASDPARRYERLSGWLFAGGRFAWPRAVGALVACTLVVYIGLRGVRPATVIDQARSPQRAPELEIPPKTEALNLPPGPAPTPNESRAKMKPVAAPVDGGVPGAAISQPVAVRVDAPARPGPAVEGLALQQEATPAAPPPAAAAPLDDKVSFNTARGGLQPMPSNELMPHDLGLALKSNRSALALETTRIDSLAPVDSLLEHEARLWPHRDDRARRAELARLAEGLAGHSKDARALARSRPLLDWLVETSPDPVERQRWLALRGSLPQ